MRHLPAVVALLVAMSVAQNIDYLMRAIWR